MARLTKLSPDNAVWKDDLSWFEGQIKELGPEGQPVSHPDLVLDARLKAGHDATQRVPHCSRARGAGKPIHRTAHPAHLNLEVKDRDGRRPRACGASLSSKFR